MPDQEATRVADQGLGARDLPALQRLLEHQDAAELGRTHPRAAVADALREAVSDARRILLETPGQAAPSAAVLLATAREILERGRRRALRPVINATGIVLHTNLGRAPLADAALRAIAATATGYTNLELDLETGTRGRRLAAIETLLQAACGAEAAVAVNNNAAAILLAIAALAEGGEVIVSRGELVEIGGGFRIPDVIAQGGARLVEVGTTNRTRLADYERAIGSATRILLKVHQSNYRIVGFTAEVPASELVALARRHALPVVHDLGSGCLTRPTHPIAVGEPTVADAVACGADLVTFSGDKLLGGPQSGLIVGRADAIARVRVHPLLRAMRLDKLSAAALEATLALHADPDRARQAIPALRMLSQPVETIATRADRLASRLAPLFGAPPEIVRTEGRPGGGALPEAVLDSRAVALVLDAATVARLRAGAPAVIGREHDGRFLLDLLAVRDDEVGTLADAVAAALPERAGG